MDLYLPASRNTSRPQAAPAADIASPQAVCLVLWIDEDCDLATDLFPDSTRDARARS